MFVYWVCVVHTQQKANWVNEEEKNWHSQQQQQHPNGKKHANELNPLSYEYISITILKPIICTETQKHNKKNAYSDETIKLLTVLIHLCAAHVNIDHISCVGDIILKELRKRINKTTPTIKKVVWNERDDHSFVIMKTSESHLICFIWNMVDLVCCYFCCVPFVFIVRIFWTVHKSSHTVCYYGEINSAHFPSGCFLIHFVSFLSFLLFWQKCDCFGIRITDLQYNYSCTFTISLLDHSTAKIIIITYYLQCSHTRQIQRWKIAMDDQKEFQRNSLPGIFGV